LTKGSQGKLVQRIQKSTLKYSFCAFLGLVPRIQARGWPLHLWWRAGKVLHYMQETSLLGPRSGSKEVINEREPKAIT